MSTPGLLFQWEEFEDTKGQIKNQIQRVDLVQSGYHYYLIKFNLLSPWFNFKIAHLALNNNRWLILYLTNQ